MTRGLVRNALRGLWRLLPHHGFGDTVVIGDRPCEGLPIGYDLTGAVSAVAVLVPVDPDTDLHDQVRQAAGPAGGQLAIPLTPQGARITAGRLAVRADEVDADHADPLAAAVTAEQRSTLRNLAFSVMPADMDDGVARGTAVRLAEQILALGWRPAAQPD